MEALLQGSTVFLSFLGIWLGFALWARQIKKWSMIIAVGGGFIVGCLALIFLIPTDPNNSSNPISQVNPVSELAKPVTQISENSSSVDQQPENPPAKKELKVAKKQFITGWNSVSQKRLKSIKYNDNVAQIEVGNSQILQLYKGGDESISSALLLFSSDKPVDIMAFMLNIAAVVAGVQPSIPENQRGEILKRLKLIGENADYDFSDEKGSRSYVKGNVKYWVGMIPQMAMMFGAESPN
jgi:hypothetical protein